ncbi:MAG TPA: RNA-binding S4 domain-containing protein [Saprospiraceae bacterium]|nr:RNA-binding S4 domain-containing protein [Saprospiraceae bacterium]
MEFNLENHEYIELNRLLKLLGMVESGGQANMFITEGQVKVNSEVEYRKRKKLRSGDQVQFMEQLIIIVD